MSRRSSRLTDLSFMHFTTSARACLSTSARIGAKTSACLPSCRNTSKPSSAMDIESFSYFTDQIGKQWNDDWPPFLREDRKLIDLTQRVRDRNGLGYFSPEYVKCRFRGGGFVPKHFSSLRVYSDLPAACDQDVRSPPHLFETFR